MIYVIDIDGTLCKEKHRWWEYELAEPIPEAIQKVNALFGRGNHIIIHTARRKEDIQVTRDWLNEHKVRYHELVMGKPRGDIYIDNDSKRMDEI